MRPRSGEMPGLAAGDELDLLAGDVGDAEDVRVGADLLDDRDARGQPSRSRARATPGRRPSTTRPQPEPAAEAGSATDSPPKGTEPFAPSGTSQRFIAGEPMKPATNVFAGRSYSVRGASHCCSRPSFSTATRWPSVIASDWSWVT